MKVVYNADESGIDRTKEVYQCHTCSKVFNWNSNSSWFGSYNQLENNPDEIKYFCSDKCAIIIKG